MFASDGFDLGIGVAAAVPATVTAVLVYISSKRNGRVLDNTNAIVQGNGRGDVLKVAEDTQDLAYETASKLREHIESTERMRDAHKQILDDHGAKLDLIVTILKKD